MVALVDRTWSDLAALIQTDFGKPVAETEVARKLVDWFHYRARLIAQRPRQVTISEEVKTQLALFPGIARIASDFRSGADMSPWLSDRVRKARDKHLADLMFNDWQVSHLHLGSHFVASNKVKRTRSLLFAYVDNKDAVLLKVQLSHDGWSDTEVLRHLLSARSDLMERWEVKGLRAPLRGYTDEERGQLRQAGRSSMLALGNRVFIPAGGVSSSRHATRLVVKTGRFLRAIRNLKEAIINNATPKETRSALAFPIGLPVQLRVQLEANGDLIVYDAVRSWGFFSEAAPA